MTVLPSSTVIFPTAVEANVTVEFALNSASSPDVQAVPPVADAGLLQLLKVQVPLVPSVLQKSSGFAGIGGLTGLNVSAVLLAKIVEDQRSEIRGRRSVLFASAGGLIHACSLNHDRPGVRGRGSGVRAWDAALLIPAVDADRVRAMNGKAKRAKSKELRAKSEVKRTRPEQRSEARGRRLRRLCRSTLPSIPSSPGRGSG